MRVMARSLAGLRPFVALVGPDSHRSVKSGETRKNPLIRAPTFVKYASFFCSDRMEANGAIPRRAFGVTKGLRPFRMGRDPARLESVMEDRWLSVVDFFNRVHELDPELTDEQLRALLLRIDSWLTYI
jgi:hypothetical protein